MVKNNPLSVCFDKVSEHNTAQEEKGAFIVFIKNGFVNLKWEQQYQQSRLIEINYWPLLADSCCWKAHCQGMLSRVESFDLNFR